MAEGAVRVVGESLLGFFYTNSPEYKNGNIAKLVHL